MTKHSDIISSKLIIILILFSLTTIFGCDGDDWGFDLFGGDSVNEDDDNGIIITAMAMTTMASGFLSFRYRRTVILLNFQRLFFPPSPAVPKATNRLSFFPHLMMGPISQNLPVSLIAVGREMYLRCHRMGNGLPI